MSRATFSEILREPGGCIHMSGIGGIGMAGLAYHLKQRGFMLTGSDVAANAMTAWLAEKGILAERGHHAERITPQTRALIRSTAVALENSEVVKARELGLPVIQRGVALAALMDTTSSVAVSGTHGKSTTAALIAHIARSGNVEASFCIGAEVAVLDGVAGVGDSPWFVAEADESDGSVVNYRPTISVITNIEYDHMEHFDSEGDVLACFRQFVEQSEHVIYCADDTQAAALCADVEKATSYGLAEDAHVRATHCSLRANDASFNVIINGADQGRVTLSLSGLHNVTNALGALAAALRMGVAFGAIARALETFTAPKRRFETICSVGGATVISDYAHHPTEIRTVIDSAKRLKPNRIVAIFQPHRYTRTQTLGAAFPPAFHGVDFLFLTPVYAASEKPIEGGRGEDLFVHFTADGQVPTEYVSSLDQAWKRAQATLEEGDVLLLVGAGDIEVIGVWAKTANGSESMHEQTIQ